MLLFRVLPCQENSISVTPNCTEISTSYLQGRTVTSPHLKIKLYTKLLGKHLMHWFKGQGGGTSGSSGAEGTAQTKGVRLQLLPKAHPRQAGTVCFVRNNEISFSAGILARLPRDQILGAQFVCHAVAYFCLIGQPLLNVLLLSTTNLQTRVHTSECVCGVCVCMRVYVSSRSFRD